MGLKSIQRIKIVCNILSLDKEFDGLSCIAHLEWKKIPEAAKYVKTVVMGDSRIAMYKLNETTIIEVSPYGYFQIM